MKASWLYFITIKGKPATLEQIYDCERGAVPWHIEASEREGFIVAATKREAIRQFLHHIGFTWKERKSGIECEKGLIS